MALSVCPDPRNIVCGCEIPSEGYCDQPYVVVTDDGAWLCVMTTGKGVEGQAGQHIISIRSRDRGKTWSPPVDIEPAGGPEASWVVPLKVPSGRIYVFYTYNADNLREVKADDPPFAGGVCKRVDSLGAYAYRYSDDGGRSWSKERWEIPVRPFEIDRQNAYGGKVRFFWNVGKPFLHNGAAYVPMHKVGGFGQGFFTRSEGALLKSPNLPTERNPDKIAWETLPDGEIGLRTPPGGGPIAEEQSFCVLSDGAFYCVYRTIDGHPACAYSRDGGHTWTPPQYESHADGRRMKHPRAANFVWRCSNSRYLYWFHNHGGRFIPIVDKYGYNDRNPVWLCGGIEADTAEGKVIRWSQPEILFYDDDPFIRMSYPDLVEEGGRYFFTETQKNIARTHEVDRSLLDGLWNQFDNPSPAAAGILLALPSQGTAMPTEAPMPKLPDFVARDNAQPDYRTKDLRQGFAVDLWVRLDTLGARQVLLDSRSDNGQGLCLETTSRGTVEIVLNDGRAENRWDSDAGAIEAGKLHHIAAIVDGGPKVITFVVDGRLCNGGDHRQFGWGRFSPHLRHANGDKTLRIGKGLKGEIKALRVYGRYLRTSEAIGNYRAGVRAQG